MPGGYKQPKGGMNRVKLLPPPTSQGSVSSPYIMGTANLLLCQNLNTEERECIFDIRTDFYFKT